MFRLSERPGGIRFGGRRLDQDKQRVFEAGGDAVKASGARDGNLPTRPVADRARRLLALAGRLPVAP